MTGWAVQARKEEIMETETPTREELTKLQFYTQSTCGEACWEAREDICRCSCGGKNHGILRKGGERPQRTRKMQQYRYTLQAVVVGYSAACRAVRDLNSTVPDYDPWRWNPSGGDCGDPYTKQKAGRSALNWQEVDPFVDHWARSQNQDLYEMMHEIYLIWRRQDVTPPPNA